MQCELCGRECECRPANVDGVKMMVCPGCMRYGVGLRGQRDTTGGANKDIVSRIKKPKVKDVYKDMNKELISRYNTVIRNGREKKGLSREELGFKIGERTVTIAKIENGDLKPSDKTAQKLEKELDISLFEEVKPIPKVQTGSQSRGLTLGDFIKKEE